MPKVNSNVIDYDDVDDKELEQPAFVDNTNKGQEGGFTIPPVVGDTKEEPQDIVEDKLKDTPVEEKPFKAFNSEEEFNAVLEAERNKAIVEMLGKPKEEAKQAEDVKFFDETWTPTDWNDYTKNLLTNPEVRKVLVKELSPDIKSNLDSMTQEEKSRLDEADKQLDAEYDALFKEGKVPSRDTEEGKKVDIAISKIGAQYGLGSLTKAYDLWSKIPEEHGGGFKLDTKKSSFDVRKAKSGLIGGGSSGGAVKNKPLYKDIHGKSMDELMQEETDE